MIIESWCTLCVTLHSGTSGEQTSSKLCGSAGVIAPLQSPVLKTGVPSQQASGAICGPICGQSAGHPLVDFVVSTLLIRLCLLFPVKTREGFGQACSAYMGGRRSFIEGIAGLAGIQRGGAVHVSWNVWWNVRCMAPEFGTFPRKAVENYEHEAAAGGIVTKAGTCWRFVLVRSSPLPCLRPGECTVYGCMKCVPADVHRYRTACVVPLLCEHPSEGLDIDNQLVAVSVRVRRHRSGTARTAAETFPQVFNALHS
jgi:hypothetical protein